MPRRIPPLRDHAKQDASRPSQAGSLTSGGGLSHPAPFPIKLVTLQNTRDVAARAWKVDVLAKGLLRHCGIRIVIRPALGPTRAGVIFRKGENGRFLLVLPMLKGAAQIPAPRFQV